MTSRFLAAVPLLLIAACAPDPPEELDLTPYRNRACELVALDRLAGFGVTQPGNPSGDGDSCLWRSGDTTILVRLEPHDGQSFSADAGTVNGFPASRWEVGGQGTRLACSTTIDTRHRQLVTVIVHAPADACAASDAVASAAIDTARAAR